MALVRFIHGEKRPLKAGKITGRRPVSRHHELEAGEIGIFFSKLLPDSLDGRRGGRLHGARMAFKLVDGKLKAPVAGCTIIRRPSSKSSPWGLPLCDHFSLDVFSPAK